MHFAFIHEDAQERLTAREEAFAEKEADQERRLDELLAMQEDAVAKIIMIKIEIQHNLNHEFHLYFVFCPLP